MKTSKLILLGLISATFISCSTAELDNEGQSVEVVYEKPAGKCRNLGPVFGKGGGQFGGGWISDEKLMEFASNDIRNKAAKKGATHVMIKNHQMGSTGGQYGSTTSTATFSGVALRCKS